MASKSPVLTNNSSTSVDDHKEEEEEDNKDDVVVSMSKLSLDHGKTEAKVNKEKFLLILDLNGLLIHRVHLSDKSKIPKNRRPDAVFANKMVFKRPYCKEFMRFCLDKFEVAIWSSAMEHNVDAIMDLAFGELKSKLLFVWNQKQCSDFGFKCIEKKEKPLFFKELYKVWKSSDNEFRKKGMLLCATNTLLLDDTPLKGLLNPPNTGIYLDSYDPRDINDNSLDPKGELASYLMGLAEAEDVPSYVASHPFGKPAVTSADPHWNFYSKVLQYASNFNKQTKGLLLNTNQT